MDDREPLVRVRESPTPSILRLSLVVYAAVALTTVLAVGTWVWMRKAGDIPIEPSPHLPGGAMVSRMILIPSQTFQDKPARKQFYIDTAEVTNAEFCAIIHCADASLAPGLPAVNMTAVQAREYANYKGKRLPTALEWERAARDANPAYRMARDVWDLVESPAGPIAEALGSDGVLKPARLIPERYSAPDIGFRCVKDP
jgi:hypothetical protein